MSNPQTNVVREVLTTVADSYDQIRPGSGDGDTVRKFAEEKYPDHIPTCLERLQHLANLCDRHKRDLLPLPTESVCVGCTAEREAKNLRET